MKAIDFYTAVKTDPSKFPLSFLYGKERFVGFPKEFFRVTAETERQEGEKRTATILVRHENLCAEIELCVYEKYNVFEYTVSFFPFGSEKTDVVRKLFALDYALPKEYTHLSGMLGDHKNLYREYKKDLAKKKVSFVSDLGRATHVYAPYFQLSSSTDGVRIALGWCGTWNAFFSAEETQTRIKMQGTLGLDTYLLSGEKIRTPLVSFLFYEGEDGTNPWRRWVTECVMPKQDGKPVAPFSTVFYAMDTGRPNSDGSISEGYDSYQRSMDAFYGNGLTADFRWFDAGWYCDPKGNTVEKDWYGTVGTWELDKVKWPDNSFLESVLYARKNQTKTLVWFEPERLTHTDSLIQNYGLKKDWILYSQPKLLRFWLNKNRRELLDLGNPKALEWIRNRILDFFNKYDVDMYREDFNTDPASFWRTADKKKGRHRRGLTENLYVQGHYRLWDEILSYCLSHGKCTFLDSCASGGGRNDLESLRRSVPLLRSDRDRTTVDVRLSMTTSLGKWIPFSGAVAKESSGELDNGTFDLYVLRASYLPAFSLSASWFHDKTIDYALLRKALSEWNQIKEYFYSDFYVLTPYNDPACDTHWTVFQYFDPVQNKGAIQAFRQAHCAQSDCTIRMQGVDLNRFYKIENIDGEKSVMQGKELTSFVLHADTPRTALVFYFQAE